MSDSYVLLSGVGPKPFLDINCNNINCNILTANEVIDNSAVSSLFCYYQSGAVNVPTSTSLLVAMNTASIANASFNVGTNIFTVPVNGDYRFDVSFNVTNTVINQEMASSLLLRVNGADFPSSSSTNFLGPGSGQRTNSVSFSLSLPLVAGDLVGFRLTNGSASTANITGGRFLGQLL